MNVWCILRIVIIYVKGNINTAAERNDHLISVQYAVRPSLQKRELLHNVKIPTVMS